MLIYNPNVITIKISIESWGTLRSDTKTLKQGKTIRKKVDRYHHIKFRNFLNVIYKIKRKVTILGKYLRCT